MNNKNITKKKISLAKEPITFFKKYKKIIIFPMKNIFNKSKINKTKKILKTIIYSSSTRINQIAKTITKSNPTSKYKTNQNNISSYFSKNLDDSIQNKLDKNIRPGNVIKKSYNSTIENIFLDKKNNDIYTYDNKSIWVLDDTAISKRSRGVYKNDSELKNRNYMEFAGRVHDGRKDNGITSGYLLKTSGFLTKHGLMPYDYFLYSNKYIDSIPDDDIKTEADITKKMIRKIQKIPSKRSKIIMGDKSIS